jgi:uroporphyrinogen-III synthase
MKAREVQLLCTGPMGKSMIVPGKQGHIAIDVIPFIRTEFVSDDHLKDTVQQIAKTNAVVIFTSRNAIIRVIELLDGVQPLWVIFCIGKGSKETINAYFKNSSIGGIADNAALLSDVIAGDNIRDCVFFCGDQRLEELPARLKTANVQVQEIVVYKTVLTPVKVEKKYDGILFFSPSGVESFFSVNLVTSDSVFFALGNTTAMRLRREVSNKIIVSSIAQKDKLLQEAIAYFENDKQ